MPRIVHFEISVDDPQRAVKFYNNVFGWKFESWGGGEQEYWMVTTGEKDQPGIDGGMMRRTEMFPPTTNVIDVPSVDDFSVKIVKGGGTQVVPKSPIPGVGWVAYFKDTEGNVFGIYQGDHSAR
jgi:predicted enzyme related to lactoylglutathione lyase